MIYPYNKARQWAIDIGMQLQPHCELLNIAGSIRRQKPEVKDVEIVCLPKRVLVGTVDLFGADNRKEQVTPLFGETLLQIGEVVKGKPDGRYMQVKTKQGIMLDLFMPQPHDYYRQYAIRTGSASYARFTIANAWLKRGWCGTDDGLRLQSECEARKLSDDKVKWICNIAEPTLPPVWQSEREFFDWLGVQYLPAKFRTI